METNIEKLVGVLALFDDELSEIKASLIDEETVDALSESGGWFIEPVLCRYSYDLSSDWEWEWSVVLTEFGREQWLSLKSQGRI